jgi:hypothetical protein
VSGQKRSQDGANFLAKKIGRRMSDVVLPSLTLTACGSGSSQSPVKIEENSLLREVIEIKNLGLNLAQYKTVNVSDARFAISDGKLFLRDDIQLDFETEEYIDIYLNASDSEGIVRKFPLRLEIMDINEAPSNIFIQSNSVTENVVDISFGELQILDQDANEEFQIILSDERFEIRGDEIFSAPGVSFNYEEENQILLDVTAIDKGGLSIEKTFVFRIMDINEAPTQIHIDQLNDYYFNDQVITTNTLIGSVFVIDDALGENVIKIQGEDADYFMIDGSNLFLKPSVLPSEFDKQFLSIELMAYDVELGVELATSEVLNLRLAPVSLDLFTDLETPITVADLDRSRSFTAGDEITLQFSAAVDVQSVDIDDFILDEGSLGDAIIRAVSEGESSVGFVMTLGQTSQFSEGANLTLEKYSILDEFGRANGVEINFTAPKADNFFNIDLVYSGAEQYSQIFSTAARIWESVIVGDIKDVGSIDDVKIDVTVETIDGPGEILAYASYTLARSENDGGLPYRGYMVFDVNDLADISYAEAMDVALHEIAHVLGFGTLWEDFGLISVLEAAYFGTNAVNAYNEAGGQGRFVPLETEGGEGTAYAHWDEIILTRELMTGYIEDGENYLSAISIAAMEDLGYVVSYASAEAFLLAPAVS